MKPPIFILGPPRSGTSLLRQMLNRHPARAICDETHFFRLVYQKRRCNAFGDLSNPVNRERLVNQYVSLQRTQRLGIDCAKLAERLQREATSYQAMFTSVLSYNAESQGKRRSGEKTPGHSLFVETLCQWFPDAVILHIVRDSRDVVASLPRAPPFAWPCAIINARTWLRFNLAIRKTSHRPQYLRVSYENLVREPDRELTRICKFIGEEYSPSMPTPEQISLTGPVWRDGYLSPLTTARMGRWREELTPEQIAQIEWVLGPYRESFGYAREAPRASFGTIFSRRLATLFWYSRDELSEAFPPSGITMWRPRK